MMLVAGQKKLHALLDVGKAQAELKLITSERDMLKERLQGEEDARQLLEGESLPHNILQCHWLNIKCREKPLLYKVYLYLVFFFFVPCTIN
jgi:hypothetical protein